MKGYVVNNRAKSAVELALNLPKSERNIVTLLLWTNAIAQIGDVKLADQIHSELNSLSSSTRVLVDNDRRFLNALIDVLQFPCFFFPHPHSISFHRWTANVDISLEWNKLFKISNNRILSLIPPWRKPTSSMFASSLMIFLLMNFQLIFRNYLFEHWPCTII